MFKLILWILLCQTTLFGYAKEITINVTLSNHTNIPFDTGYLMIEETQQKIVFKDTVAKKIKLPRQGKYNLRFVSEGFYASIKAPSTIEKETNIKIILIDTKNIIPFLTDADSYNLTPSMIAQQLSEGTLNFTVHTILPRTDKKQKAFKTTYGIGFEFKNCAMDPKSYALAKKHNTIIANYLNKKYGKTWLTDLPITPTGLAIKKGDL